MTKTKYPTTQKILDTFTLKTQTGVMLHETIKDGQKEILECILNRKSPSGKNKIHVMAHTRYGKSIIVGAGVAIMASIKKQKWAIVAPTKEDAQIIMDYVLFFCMGDPIIKQLLKTDARILKTEMLTQRRSRDHITFLNGGEIRTYSAGQVMGHGAQNIILDEACIATDEEEAKVFRMLGDNPKDFFIMKIGNPFENNHFKRSLLNDSYYKINIDAKRGLKEGRLSQEILDEQKGKPFFNVLYWNIFPDQASRDKYGYLPLISDSLLERAQVEGDVDEVGDKILGGDPADSGSNDAVIVTRSNNYARIRFVDANTDPITFADECALLRDEVTEMHIDGNGVGAGSVKRLDMAKETKRKLVSFKGGEAVDQDLIPENEKAKDYLNLRAYAYWKLKEYLEGGGKLEKDPRWNNLLAVRYKTNSKGKIQIIPKDLLEKAYYNIHDLGVADALSMTFNPTEPEEIYVQPSADSVGGIEPYYPDLGNF